MLGYAGVIIGMRCARSRGFTLGFHTVNGVTLNSKRLVFQRKGYGEISTTFTELTTVEHEVGKFREILELVTTSQHFAMKIPPK